ncbi:hypothetical protein [Ruegeria sp. THAF33]|uniref:hypothetical protein n=1 Tax=Ruegeria sp. THAF33 TaxID=2587853 RepID=UPI001269457F|nr:hypothetical protein [Ruegeria sp. THAF33]QFT72174.1 hypothetical protein FIU92_03975 [Ruegeria sp. THAF33]
MVDRVTLGGGDATVQTMISSKEHASSRDYVSSAVTVRNTNNIQREVHSQSDLSDTDVINVQGMSMKVAQAKELGLLNTVFDEGLSFGAAQRAAQDHQSQTQETPEETPRSDTGFPEFDTVVDGLNAALDDDIMTMGEAQVYEAAFGQIAMSGMSVDEVTETMRGLADGSVSELDVDGSTRAMFANVQSTVTEAATQSAMQELGPDGFDFLKQAAFTNPGVDRVVRQFAVDRAAGRADGITWTEFAQHIREQLGH